jgi:transcriptional regulator with XRE-family HTH domain
MWNSQEVKIMNKKEWFHVFETDYTQVEIANLMGVKQPQVSNWLNGKRIPTSSNLIKLAGILQMYPENLLQKLEEIKQVSQA